MSIAAFAAGSLTLVLLGAVCFGAAAWYGSTQLIHPPRRRPAAAPGDYGLEYKAISFQSRDGITLRGWFVFAPNPNDTSVLCHSFAGDCSADLRHAPSFVDAGFEVLLFDFRGHGASDDALVPAAHARELYRAARDPKELWIVQGAAHREIEAVAPVEYRDRVIRFFLRAFEQGGQ